MTLPPEPRCGESPAPTIHDPDGPLRRMVGAYLSPSLRPCLGDYVALGPPVR